MNFSQPLIAINGKPIHEQVGDKLEPVSLAALCYTVLTRTIEGDERAALPSIIARAKLAEKILPGTDVELTVHEISLIVDRLKDLPLEYVYAALKILDPARLKE